MVTEKSLRFNVETIKFSEIMELGEKVNNFMKKGRILEKAGEMESYKDPSQVAQLFTDLPGLILQDKESMKEFIQIIEFCFGDIIDDDKGIEALQMAKKTLEFLHEVNLLGFLRSTALTLRGLIGG